jgi:Fe-S-cluster containining protein
MQALIQSRASRRRRKERLRTRQIAQDAMRERVCRRCGACCSSYAILLTQVDVDAESKLKSVAMPISQAQERLVTPAHPDELYYIAGTEKRPARCPMLAEDNLCLIYYRRPRACRRYPSCRFWCHCAALEKAGLNVLATLQAARSQKIPLERIIVAILEADVEKFKAVQDENLIKETADVQSQKK